MSLHHLQSFSHTVAQHQPAAGFVDALGLVTWATGLVPLPASAHPRWGQHPLRTPIPIQIKLEISDSIRQILPIMQNLLFNNSDLVDNLTSIVVKKLGMALEELAV